MASIALMMTVALHLAATVSSAADPGTADPGTADPGTADPGTWWTSSDLLKAQKGVWTRLDSETRSGLLADRRKGMGRALIVDYLEGESVWFVHRGDLTLPRSLSNGHGLIVLGNLKIEGSYDDYSYESYTGSLVVMGDFEVEHVASWGGLHVDGDLRSSGLVFAAYNDFTFEVAGTLSAKILVVDDKSAEYDSPSAGLELTTWAEVPPEVVYQSIRQLDGRMWDVGYLDGGSVEELWPSFDDLQRRIASGLPVFRQPPAGEDLIANLEKVLDPATTPPDVNAVAVTDPLAMRLAAYWREDLSKATLEAMLQADDLELLRALKDNESVPRKVRKRADQRFLELWGLARQR
ncbi:MAG: hypothetical protein AAGD06_09095 [Acidobacteriota bacterium]